MSRVETLVVAGDPDQWRSLGLIVTEDGTVPLVGTSLRIEPAAPDGPMSGIVGWELSDVPVTAVGPADRPSLAAGADAPEAPSVDGLRTRIVAPRTPTFARHLLGAIGLDHVVVLTGDLARTSDAVAGATGSELRRIREAGEVRQGFHRIGRGGLVVEIVERAELGDDPADFWGVVVNVEDLDAACELLGEELIGAPKDAVQPGRRIATLRTAAGVGVPLALMTP